MSERNAWADGIEAAGQILRNYDRDPALMRDTASRINATATSTFGRALARGFLIAAAEAEDMAEGRWNGRLSDAR